MDICIKRNKEYQFSTTALPFLLICFRPIVIFLLPSSRVLYYSLPTEAALPGYFLEVLVIRSIEFIGMLKSFSKVVQSIAQPAPCNYLKNTNPLDQSPIKIPKCNYLDKAHYVHHYVGSSYPAVSAWVSQMGLFCRI